METAEVVQTSSQLVVIVEQSHLEKETARNLIEKFNPFFEKAQEWKTRAAALVVTDVSQKKEMQDAAIARKALKALRVEADKTRKALKEDSLRYGKAVQGVYNLIEYLIVPIEEHLEKQERFAEVQEASRKEALRVERHKILSDYISNPELYPLGEISQQAFEDLLNGFKLAKAKREEDERLAKEAEVAGQKAEAEERERQRLENEKLRAEAIEKEKALAIERGKVEKERLKAEAIRKAEQEKADALLEAQRKAAAKAKAEADKKIKAAEDEKNRIAAELKAKQDKEAAEEKARVLAVKKAQAAPDKAKLIELAKTIDELALPELKSEDAKSVLTSATDLLAKVSNYIREKSAQL